MKAFEINKFGIENLQLVEREMPSPKESEIVVKFYAASLNYRDLLMIKGLYNPKLKMPLVPFSDGAGEVVEVGREVTSFKVGDRVCPIFMPQWLSGEIDFYKKKTARGGETDGCLREYGVFSETELVTIPENLSLEAASTLPCAAVTAWNALVVAGRIKAGDVVLVQGTGGVSIFALQFAKAMGATVIITSSSDEKLARAAEIGADHLINYRQENDWDKKVLEITEKRGVDHVIEVGGAGTIQKSLNCVRVGGHIAVIGILAAGEGLNPLPVLMKAVRMNGIFVGSREMFEDMNRMIAQHQIKPMVDKVFAFEDVRNALEYMENGSHFGKIVVKI